MTKREFLKELKEILSEQLPANQVEEHVSYYMNYIQEQQKNGNSEEEILHQLGSPRLIARTILDTVSDKKEYSRDFYEQSSQNMESKKAGLPDKYKKYLHIGIAVVILFLVISSVMSLLSFLLPILLPVILVFVVISIFRKR